jgi:hypothetical protein
MVSLYPIMGGFTVTGLEARNNVASAANAQARAGRVYGGEERDYPEMEKAVVDKMATSSGLSNPKR